MNCLFHETKKRRKFYRIKFCNDLKELATEIINYEEKKVIPITDKEINIYERQKVCHICKGSFCDDKNKKKEYDLYH